MTHITISETAATELVAAAAAAQLLHLKPSEIQVHPMNPRLDITVPAEFVDSIRSKGVLEPLVVAPRPDGVKPAKGTGYVLIAGHRRLAGAKAAKLKTVPAVLRADLDTSAAQLEAMLVENLQRQDLSPIEEGDGYQALLALDVSQAQIAERVGRPKRTVSERVRLAKLPDAVRDKIHAHQLTIEVGLAIAEFDDDPAAQADLVKVVGRAGGWEFNNRLQELRNARRGARDRAKTRKALVQDKVTVLDAFPAPSRNPNRPPTWVDLDTLASAPGDVEALDSAVRTHLGRDTDDEKEWEYFDLVDWHAKTCGGHAVVDTGKQDTSWGSSGEFVFTPICTTPTAHHAILGIDETTGQPLTPAELAAGSTGAERGAGQGTAASALEALAEQEEERVAAALAEAAAARRAHVATVLAGDCSQVATALARKKLLDLVEQIHAAPYRNAEQRQVLATFFGMAAMDKGEQAEAVKDHVSAWVEEASLDRLVTALLVLRLADWEVYLPMNNGNEFKRASSSRNGSGAWLSTLRFELGYEWTEFEAGLVPDWLLKDPATQAAIDREPEAGVS